MKCDRCGATLPENVIRCVYCGETLQMVPDYNPLGDVVEDEVRSSLLDDRDDFIPVNSQNNRVSRVDQNSRRMPDRNLERPRPVNRTPERNYERQREARVRDEKQREHKDVDIRKKREIERRRDVEKRREMEKRRAKKKKQRNIVIGCMLAAALLICLFIYMIYSNSYNGLVSKGWNAIEKSEIETGIEYFEKAIDKKSSNAEAYIALSDVYVLTGDLDLAESVLLDAIADNPDNLELNQALIEYYVLIDDMDKINDFMNSLTNDDILDALIEFQSSTPTFSLEEGEYEDVQELTITSDGDLIYYTLDGTPATEDSECYTSAIQIGEGTTTVRSISVNAEGVPSNETVAEYIVELPMESAPVVSPTTGQYTENMQITVTVPTGYTAYYTLDNTTPTTDSTMYTGSIDMPEGNTIFTVVLVNASGKTSDATKRNYDLVIEEDESEVE